MLAWFLQTKGESVFAGDISGMDTCENSQYMEAVLEIINAWYNDGEDRVRQTLWEDIKQSLHIRGNVVYEWLKCNPSGQAVTTVLNTVCLMLLYRYVWVLQHDGDVESLDIFEDHVYVVAFGDDSVVNVSDDKKDIFNLEVMIEKAPLAGFTYTDASKGKNANLEKTSKLCDVTFLKRTFKWSEDAGRIIAPLELDVILETPYWRRVSNSPVTRTLDNVEDSLLELALHGRGVFDEWYPKISKAVTKRYRRCTKMSTYEEYFEKALHEDKTY